MGFSFAPMTGGEAVSIAAWRYAPPFDVYNLPEWDVMAAKGMGIANPSVRAAEFYSFFQEGRLIGFFRLQWKQGQVTAGMGLSPPACGKGLGAELVQAVKTAAWERFGNTAVEVWVREWNLRAVRCYQAAGFRTAGRETRNTARGEEIFLRMLLEEIKPPEMAAEKTDAGEIMKELIDRYHPLAMIVYGSYSNGTNGLNSDFDALLISEGCETFHDTSVVNGVQLDVFLYDRRYVEDLEDVSRVIQIYGGRIALDTDGVAGRLMDQVDCYVHQNARKTQREKQDLRQWCEKMFLRTQRNDAEGMFRWHWLLVDSLEIYCNMRDAFYFGPKKTLRGMMEQDGRGYALYSRALREQAALKAWLEHIFQENPAPSGP